MKRIASFALAVLLILSLCACSLPQAKPAKEPIDELELVEEAAEAAEAEAPEELPIMPEETAPEASEPEALPPEETEPAAETAAEGAEMPDPVLPEEAAAPEEAPIPDAPSEVQPETAEAAEMPEPEAPERTEGSSVRERDRASRGYVRQLRSEQLRRLRHHSRAGDRRRSRLDPDARRHEVSPQRQVQQHDRPHSGQP